MDAVYGALPVELVSVPAGAVQVSPLVPGSGLLEALPVASLDSITMLAPRGNLDRRFAVAHALRALRANANYTVLAPKNSGGARLADDLAGFGCTVAETARRHHRICTGRRPAGPLDLDAAITAGAPQFVEPIGLWSQPGIFSWDRIDPGSALLIEYLPALQGRGADLGCGIGVLTRAVLLQDNVEHVTGIDLDRRAVEAARRNLDALRTTVVWADVRGADIVGTDFDFVIMNPPFHDGGAEDQDLGRQFIRRAAEMLKPGGICLLVANRHLPYEAAMAPLFRDIARPIQADGYKVYRATK
jgi:16S rRNA (guanine1207-N2)-methyltransferase